MNADVVAEDVVGHLLRHAGIELEAEPRLQLGEEALRRPALAHEEILQPRAVAALAQPLLVAEDLRHAATTRTAWSGRTKASRRTARCGSFESPPPTRSE